jgi:hypothetical protein
MSKLASLKQPISEIFKAFFFLQSLPLTPNWEVFHTATINSVLKMKDLMYAIVTTHAASQVANTSSLASESTIKSVLKALKKCLVHGDRGHSTEYCYTVQKLVRKNKNSGGAKDVKEWPKERFRGKGKKKETAKAAKESDNSDNGGASNYGSANHVYISYEMKAHIEAYIMSEPSEKHSILANSICSSNMTPNANWLIPNTVIHLKYPISVHLGDNFIIHGTA